MIVLYNLSVSSHDSSVSSIVYLYHKHNFSQASKQEFAKKNRNYLDTCACASCMFHRLVMSIKQYQFNIAVADAMLQAIILI